MAGTTVTINFDAGIEKVCYAASDVNSNSPSVTNSGDSISGVTDLYLLPILKSGYVIESVVGASLSDSTKNIYFIGGHVSPTVTFKTTQGGGRNYD